MLKEYSKLLTIIKLDRLNSSTNGNPRFRVWFAEGSDVNDALTQTDGSVGYEIQNSEWQGREILVHFTPAGRIRALEEVSA